ncbi:acyl-protein synthetase [Xylariaceae sp. FL1272]|nr:acyl-protein synthetase [Xylariaceae sp. FL1272]
MATPDPSLTSEHLNEPPEPWTSLQAMLASVAETAPSRGHMFYPLGNTSKPYVLSYSSLYMQAQQYAELVQNIEGFVERAPILIHFEDHHDFVLWFWAALLANGIPVPSSPLSHHLDHRRGHLRHLSELLETPICITRESSLDLFRGDHGLRMHTVEKLLDACAETYRQNGTKGNQAQKRRCSIVESAVTPVRPLKRRAWSVEEENKPVSDGLALLMLTSGSSGNSKAVMLTHGQVLAALRGKSLVRRLTPGRPLLNWLGLDHVGSLVELHLLAMYLGVDQIHVQAPDILASPPLFLDLLSRHQVARSFAPNGFLARLIMTVDSEETIDGSYTWDFSSLTDLISGGEANDMDTCVAVARLLSRHGAPITAMTPAFGMTETCAGSIYNINCPRYDVERDYKFASVGQCTSSMEMRINVSLEKDKVVLAGPDGIGALEVRGEAVFKSYYREDEATAASFTVDSWFRTGDRAVIDSQGNLRLIGRAQEVVNINGKKTPLAEIETAVEKALSGIVSRVVVFASRSTEGHTEQVVILYVNKSQYASRESARAINSKAMEICFLCTASRPLIYGLENESKLPISTLGKISRVRMRSLLEDGCFQQEIEAHHNLLALGARRDPSVLMPANQAELDLLTDFEETIGRKLDHSFGVETSIFTVGLTSMDLVRLKHRIDKRLGVATVSLAMLLKHQTARELAAVLCDFDTEQDEQRSSSAQAVKYDPVVTLKGAGTKTPLWLVHPGVGEVLVFIGLALQLSDEDRPIYALRARGFEHGETCFDSIAEAVDTYQGAIKKRQPKGPYAIAGYSYGSMLAFEVAKQLEKTDVVQFLGSFNLPPHIKYRMRQLNWNVCHIHLAYFLGLVGEKMCDELEHGVRDKGRIETVDEVMEVSDPARMIELGLNRGVLIRWTDVAFSLQSMAVDYEPSGVTRSIDIFHALPLRQVAKSRQDWMDNHLGKWKDFAETAAFHEVSGEHYTMISPLHVPSFSRTLVAALQLRGL